MSFLKDYPQLKVIQDLARRKKVKVYLVGGFLRDSLLKRPCYDLDFAVSQDAITLARQFSRKIKGAFILLDEEHACARVAKKNGTGIKTFDFADFRGSTLQKDLMRRDFTINTFALDVATLKASEPWQNTLDMKVGLKDFKAKRIKMTSSKAFKEDPLRLVRAFSLRALLGFKIEQQTIQQIKKDRDLIIDVSFERIRDELFKILESNRAAENLKAMDRIGLLERIIPQIAVMYHCKQGTYHHLDVWPHSLETVLQMDKMFTGLKDSEVIDYINETVAGQHSRGALMKLAALLHDIGKPDTRKREKGRISFHSHERVGKNIVRDVAKMLKLSTKERHGLEDMVLWHLRPGYLSNFKSPSERAIFRYFRDTAEEAVSIALLSLADQRATRGPATTASDQKHHEKICLSLVQRYFEKKKEQPFVRLVNGDDLIKKCRLKPSPLFKLILDEIEEKQVMGQITTKKEALDLARNLAAKHK